MNNKKVTSGKVTGIKLTPKFYHKESENAKVALIVIILAPFVVRLTIWMCTGL